MQRLKMLLALLAIAFVVLPAAPVTAATNVFSGACSNSSARSSTACQQSGADPLTGPDGVLTRATKLIGFIAGAASIIMMLVGGFMYVTSDGDSSRVNSAKETILYAFIGLVIVGVAQGIIVFVLNRL